jgi:DNA-binding NarL/FixJ family response regulator
MIRVLVADDEAIVRAGVRAVLSADPAIEVVAEAGDGRQAVELVRAHRPDVAVIDIRMPVLDGLDAAAEIRRVTAGTAVIMVTTFGDNANVVRALDVGVTGFVLKASDPRDLIAAVHAAANGAAFLSPTVAARVIAELRRSSVARDAGARAMTDKLSDRERAVLGMLGAGLSNAEIARRLFVVEGTVKSYVSTILTRLGVRNRVQAAIVAYEAGLVDRGGIRPE